MSGEQVAHGQSRKTRNKSLDANEHVHSQGNKYSPQTPAQVQLHDTVGPHSVARPALGALRIRSARGPTANFVHKLLKPQKHLGKTRQEVAGGVAGEMLSQLTCGGHANEAKGEQEIRPEASRGHLGAPAYGGTTRIGRTPKSVTANGRLRSVTRAARVLYRGARGAACVCTAITGPCGPGAVP